MFWHFEVLPINRPFWSILQNVQKCVKRRNVRTHRVPISIYYLSGHTWSELRKQSSVDGRCNVTKRTELTVLANHDRFRQSNEPITTLRAISGSQLKARENNCEQASFLFAKRMFSKTLGEQTDVTVQNSLGNYIWHIHHVTLQG